MVVFSASRAGADPVLDARALALGGLAYADGALPTALFFNPSLLAPLDSLKTSFTQNRLSTAQFDFEAAGAFPLLQGISLGFGWAALEVQNQVQYGILRDSNGQIEVNPANGQPLTQILGFFTQSDNTFFAAAAAQFGFFSLGAALKYELVDFGHTEGTGFGLDLSGTLRLSKSLRLALVMTDLGDRELHWNDGTPDRRVTGQWTAAAAWHFLDLGPVALTLEPGVRKDLWDELNIHYGGGLEASWMDQVFLRAGEDKGEAAFGVGLTAHPAKGFPELRVDYAYLDSAVNGYPSRLTLTARW